MMSCSRAVELLLDYVANDLSDDERSILEDHFRCCPPCVVYLQTYRLTIEVTHRLPREAPLPPEMETKLLAALQQMQQQGLGGAPPLQ